MRMRRRKNYRPILILGVIVLLGLSVSLVWVKISSKHLEEHQTPPTEEIKLPEPTGATSRLLFAGTTFWGRRTNTASRNSELGVAYPFAKLDTLEREKYAAWIANLECPVTENDHTETEEEDFLIFNCHTDYLDEVAKYFSAFSLGTNHADNWGEEGIETTKKNLKSVGIQYFGHYRYDNSTENCGIVVIPIEVSFDDDSTSEYKMPLGFCSAHGVFGVPTEAALENIAYFSELVPTIVMPHMGVEYQSSADEIRTNLFRKIIDYGTDMVLADHPHWIQNSETYNGKLIVYSMGNFMFDQQAVETNRSAAIAATANFDKSVDFETWNKLGELCLEKSGDCIEEIKEKNLEKININWQDYTAIGTFDDGYQTRLATEAEQASIETRLDWQTTLAGLNQQ